MASNRNVLKKYAPQARLDFIQAVTNRAAQFGIIKDGHDAGQVQGDLFILNGKAFPRSVANQRGRLIARIARDGFAQTMEAVAYTWFNRFLAIRYMELHGYLDHGYRVLSSPAGHAEPEILERATSVELPGLDRDEIVNLKLDGTKDEQIYRKLLIAQCNDLHRAMPFLFEKIDDETELLLPGNLLQSDSIVRKLVNEIAEEEWQEIEIIGWLYQFYISEKKDQVIGKVVKSEDIPAATQLFTPNWIVKYMVQNSLGAQWLATYPNSGIRANYPMDYYIASAEQTPEVQAQIDAITPKQLDPEAIALIDPAVGSGHILVEAYDLFRAIYLERGYTKREAARAILTKNLFGLDIDDRAAQMAGFALLMKACADDRTVVRNPPKLNVLALQDSEGLDADALAKALLPQERFEIVPSGDLLPETLSQPTLSAQQPTSAEAKAIKALVTVFDGAKTFGSLITVPDAVMQSLPLLDDLLAKPLTGDLYHRRAQEEAQEALKPLVEQARLLGSQYDCVVANPPYMGGKGMNAKLKPFITRSFPNSKADLYASFAERSLSFSKINGLISLITRSGWTTNSRFANFRANVILNNNLTSLLDLGSSAFAEISGEVVTSTAFTIAKRPDAGNYTAIDLKGLPAHQKALSFGEPDRRFPFSSTTDCKFIEGSPIIYSLPKSALDAFRDFKKISDVAMARQGIATGDDEKYVRQWSEVSAFGFERGATSNEEAWRSGKTWFPLNKGGESRKWYGNSVDVIKFNAQAYSELKLIGNHCPSEGLYFKEAVSWSDIATRKLCARYRRIGEVFATLSMSVFPVDASATFLAAYLNSEVNTYLISKTSPGLHYSVGYVANQPICSEPAGVAHLAQRCIEIAKTDWDSQEISWEFNENPLLALEGGATSLAGAYSQWLEDCRKKIEETAALEEENNRIFIEAYGLQDELTPDVPLSEITLTCNPHYRYGGDLTDQERGAKLKADTMRELVSYAVGCMMGRYSLAEPGLIYAHCGGGGFDPSRYGPFPADDDGIIPMTEEQWFPDDAGTRIEEFLGVAWPEAPVMETMSTLMDGLTMGKAGEPRAALRSYLSKQFYKDHLQTYNNRPIYWLFSSGKQKAFEALVYLHRYNEGTLARMRTIYVTPLMGKLQQRISDLDSEIAASSSSAEKTRKTRDKDKLAKQVVELRAFDEELRHLADQRIPLDLDDGVKVNYARFGNLLAAKDKVCPKKKGEDE